MQSARLKDQFSECPLLLRIFHAFLWADDRDVDLREMRCILNVSWDELRTAICCLRPLFSDTLPDLCELSRFTHNSMINPPTWRVHISMDLAFGCIRVRHLVKTGNLPEYVWYIGTLNRITIMLMVGQEPSDSLGTLHKRISMLRGIVERRQGI
jgi:hypothetical protein